MCDCSYIWGLMCHEIRTLLGCERIQTYVNASAVELNIEQRTELLARATSCANGFPACRDRWTESADGQMKTSRGRWTSNMKEMPIFHLKTQRCWQLCCNISQLQLKDEVRCPPRTRLGTLVYSDFLSVSWSTLRNLVAPSLRAAVVWHGTAN